MQKKILPNSIKRSFLRAIFNHQILALPFLLCLNLTNTSFSYSTISSVLRLMWILMSSKWIFVHIPDSSRNTKDVPDDQPRTWTQKRDLPSKCLGQVDHHDSRDEVLLQRLVSSTFKALLYFFCMSWRRLLTYNIRVTSLQDHWSSLSLWICHSWRSWISKWMWFESPLTNLMHSSSTPLCDLTSDTSHGK